jgi:hypothetical protein
MPTYNAERYLSDAIDSVLEQTHEELELIVVDDGSTDASAEIAKSFDDDRVRYHRQDNAGEGAARNTGLGLARGDFVCWNDADDLSLPHRLEKMLEPFENPQVDFAHCDALLIDENDDPVGYWASRQTQPEDLIATLLAAGTPFNNNTMLLRRELVGDNRFDPSVGFGTDTDFVARVCARRRAVHVAAPLLLYRRHEASMSTGDPYVAREITYLLDRESLLDLLPQARAESVPEDVQHVIAAAVIGRSLIRRHDMNNGKPLLESAARDADRLPEPWRGLVLGALQLAVGKAAEAYQLLSGCETPEVLVWQLRGEALAELGHTSGAATCFVQAALRDPEYPEPARALSRLFGPHRIAC